MTGLVFVTIIDTRMGQEFSTASIEETYRDHPIRMDNLLRRISPEKIGVGKLSEFELAYDPVQHLTDQNHIGGADFVIEIGKRLNLSEFSRVLELGSGIGGAARLLAAQWGCEVTGVDVSTQRVMDSIELSKLCGLSQRTRFLKCDFNELPPDFIGVYDVILSQNSLLHASDLRRVIKNWATCLQLEGRLVLEDAYLKRTPSETEAKRLERLLIIWKSYLNYFDKWERGMVDSGCKLDSFEELTQTMRGHFANLDAFSQTHQATSAEHESYSLALDLIDCGVIGYFRAISLPLLRG